MPIVVNGVGHQVPEGATLVDLLGHLGIAQDRVAIELNGAIVRKQDWSATPVEYGSRLEIVQFVGGG